MNTDGKKLSCMIIDDNSHIADMMVLYLIKNGTSAEKYASGAAGLQAYLSNPYGYDVIMLDLNMPGLSGREVASTIRHSGHQNALTIPIVVMTGSSAAEVMGKGDFSYFLKKPFEFSNMLNVINEIAGL